MKVKRTNTPLRRALLAMLLAMACLVCAVPAFAVDGAGAGYHYESEQWNLSMIHADGAFARGALGQGVRVGVLDSGINPHDGFGDRLLPGHNYMEDADDENDTSDSLGHGTAVAGLIAGANERGYIGTAPGAMLVPLKVTDGNEVSINAVCRAIYGGVDDYGCKVLNLSLGVSDEYESLKEAIDYATEKGVIVVAATGNDGTSTVYYPAGYDSVIGVGAVNHDGTAYYNSVHNSSVCVTAPGVRVRSTGNDEEYKYCTGMSFAVPQVAGAAAVLLGLDPTLTPGQIAELLSKTATDRGTEGYDEYFGYGILNLTDCVEALTGEEITIPDEPSEQQELITDYRNCLGDDACVLAAYSDLNSVEWYHDGVHWALSNSVMNGVGDGLFAPHGTVTRGMVMTMLARVEGVDTTAGEGHTWYDKGATWAIENGISDGTDPTASVTREQFATMLYRYAQYKGTDVSVGEDTNILSYNDVQTVSSWAMSAMQWAVGSGVINGIGSNLEPAGNATRAQVATMLMRYSTVK